MSTIYMLSGPLKNKGFNGNVKKYLKSDLINKNSIAFIASQPLAFEKNDTYVYGNESIHGLMYYLNKISKIKKIYIIDERINKEEAKKIINEVDVIYLLGGDSFSQIEYIKKNKYDKILKNYSGLVIGTSAGAMNLGKTVYYSKDERYDKSTFYSGIGLVDITIDPHFDIRNIVQLHEIVSHSANKELIGLPNKSAIRIIDSKVEFINKCYIFKNKEQKVIN